MLKVKEASSHAIEHVMGTSMTINKITPLIDTGMSLKTEINPIKWPFLINGISVEKGESFYCHVQPTCQKTSKHRLIQAAESTGLHKAI